MNISMYHTIIDAETGDVTQVPFTPEEETEFWERRLPMAWTNLRATRDELLRKSDLKVLPDLWYSYDEPQKKAWSDYRKALRDLPENTEDPFNPEWPEAPKNNTWQQDEPVPVTS